ncbi:unnamed protein product [Victoria cruziana]
MAAISQSGTLACFLVLVFFLGRCSSAGERYAGREYFQIASGGILPPAMSLCKGFESYQQGKGVLKVVDRHGPCFPFAGKQGTAANGTLLAVTEVIKHDQSRIQWINSRASSSSSHDKRLQDPFQTDAAIDLPARAGAPLGTANFLVTVGLGTPKQDFNVAFDTGSDLTWVQCEPCTSCYEQQGPKFNPSTSSTYRKVSCTAPECAQAKLESGLNQCSASSCLYGILYGDKSMTIGQLSKDKLTLSGSDVVNGFTFGCGKKNQGLFGMVGGLLGLGRTKLSVVSQAMNKYGGVFSYCLPTSNNVGHLTFGPDRSSYSQAKFTPLLPHDKFYYVPLTGISVGGRLLPVSSSVFGNKGTVLDSGTVITRLPPAAYGALRSAFRAFMAQQNYPLTLPISILDTCYDLSSYTLVQVPKIVLHFRRGSDLDLDVRNIVIASSLSQVCLAFAGNAEAEDVGIIGNWQQKTTLVVHDIPSSKIGFVQGACS